MRRTLEERFWAKVNKNGPGGCWDWTACTAGRGYGYINDGGTNRYAHRLSYEMHKGPIPEGMLVCHKCDRPECVNPKCLFLGTQTDNMRDMVKKGRKVSQIGSCNNKAILSESQVLLIKKFISRDLGLGSLSFLSRWFGVHLSAIRQINDGKTWKHVKEGI